MKNNMPAYPSQELYQDYYGPMNEGMTLRDYFAGQVIMGIWAGRSDSVTYDDTARWAYAQADAMMEARDK